MLVLTVHQHVALSYIYHKTHAPHLLNLLVPFHQQTLFIMITPIAHPYHHIEHLHNLTPITAIELSELLSSSIVHSSMQTTRSPFCRENITDNDDVIVFSTGFSNYRRLITCSEFLGTSLHHLNTGEANLRHLQLKTEAHHKH